jgi:hypothetical protein
MQITIHLQKSAALLFMHTCTFIKKNNQSAERSPTPESVTHGFPNSEPGPPWQMPNPAQRTSPVTENIMPLTPSGSHQVMISTNAASTRQTKRIKHSRPLQ